MDFNYKLEPRFDRFFVSPPGRSNSLILRWQFGKKLFSDVLEDELQLAGDDRAISPFQAAAHTYLYTLRGGELASSRRDRGYVSFRHAASI